MTGLIELVHARGGREDLYQIGRSLHLEIDDLFPLVEAADLLDLADTEEGDLVLTEQGNVSPRRAYWKRRRFSATRPLPMYGILREIVQALEQAPGRVVPEEHILHLLEEHFSTQEAQAQMDTAIDWGRYAELFSFQEDRGIFRLEEATAAESA